MKIIALGNQKGGVGKTSTATNLAYCLALYGHKTLLVDLDPQGHSTLTYGGPNPLSVFIECLFSGKQDEVAHITTKALSNDGHTIDNLFLMGSSIRLAMASEQAISRIHREKILLNGLKSISNKFDFILIDCPPNLGILSINAIYAADHILIPINPSRYSIEGMEDLCHVMAEVKGYETDAGFSILMNNYDKRNSVTNRFFDEHLKTPMLQEALLETIIRKSESINQAQINESCVFTFDPKSTAVEDYDNLTKELLRRLNNGKEKAKKD